LIKSGIFIIFAYLNRNGCDCITLLKDEAYSRLLKMINDGKIKYNETYSLNMIASELNMSRTPVRDAIQKLCDENQLDLLPSRGFRLHVMTPKEILQLYHFSMAIEGYCAIHLAKQYLLNPENVYVKKLEQLFEAMEKCDLDSVSFSKFYQLDNDFHYVLIASLEDEYFNMLSQSKRGFYNHPELHLTEESPNRQKILACHKHVLDAIHNGDCIDAYKAMLEHADFVYDNYTNQIENYM